MIDAEFVAPDAKDATGDAMTQAQALEKEVRRLSLLIDEEKETLKALKKERQTRMDELCGVVREAKQGSLFKVTGYTPNALTPDNVEPFGEQKDEEPVPPLTLNDFTYNRNAARLEATELAVKYGEEKVVRALLDLNLGTGITVRSDLLKRVAEELAKGE